MITNRYFLDIFFFHGHTGHNTGFPHSGAGQGVHENAFIGVYPQGEVTDTNQPACCRQNLCKETGEHCGTGWNDGSMTANKCAWNDFGCQKDPNDGNFTAGIITQLRAMGASGRVYMWGGSNGANSVQIFAANAGPAMPITAISCGWGQLMAEPPRSGPSPFNWVSMTACPLSFSGWAACVHRCPALCCRISRRSSPTRRSPAGLATAARWRSRPITATMTPRFRTRAALASAPRSGCAPAATAEAIPFLC